MENEIKVVQWTIDDVIGELKRISLVSEPAIEQDFMLFSKSNNINFKTIDDMKRILTGPAMRPNIKIKRIDEMGEIYYGIFSEDVVRQSAQLFFKKGSNINKTNLEHQWEIDGVYVFESWIVENPDNDKSKELGFNSVQKGDWFVSMKIDNDVVWNNYLKTGIIKGFSVEAKLGEEVIGELTMKKWNKIKEIINSKSNDNNKFNSIYEIVVDANPHVDETGGLTHSFESYNDYPDAAKKNAQIALDWAEENGWGSCGTPVGKKRANQLAGGENITVDTIRRMASFERHRGNSNKELGDGCGRLMWQAWGGDEGIAWAQRKLEQIKNEKMMMTIIDIFGYKPLHFDICPVAIELYNHIVTMNADEDTIGMIRSSAQILDNIFRIEKVAIEKKSASPDELNEAIILAEDFIDLFEEIDEELGMSHDLSFLINHIKTIQSLVG
jgi:hypothetical protein